MIRLVAGIASAILAVASLTFSPGALAQTLLDARDGDAFYYRGTGGVPPQ